MPTVEHYREEAERCRRLAANNPDSKYVERWLLLARNYDLMAVALQKRLSTRTQHLLENASMSNRHHSPTKP